MAKSNATAQGCELIVVDGDETLVYSDTGMRRVSDTAKIEAQKYQIACLVGKIDRMRTATYVLLVLVVVLFAATVRIK